MATTELTSTQVDVVTNIEAAPAEAPADQPERFWTVWDIVAILLFASVMLGVAWLELKRMAPGPLMGWPPAFEYACVGFVGLSVLALVAALVWRRPRLATVPGLLSRVWLDPPSGLAAFILAALVATPILGRYSPILTYDSDSARLVASISYVQDGHLGYFAETQEPYLAHVLLGPALALGGLEAAKLAILLSVQALAGVVGYVAYRVTGLMWAAIAASLAIFTVHPLLDQAGRLPMYLPMLAIGTMGAWMSYEAMTEPKPRWRTAIAAGLLVALTPEAHAVGQLFLAAPALMLPFAPSVRGAVVRLARVYGVVLVGFMPRILINLADGGLSNFTTTRSDYWVNKKYLNQIQADFWKHTFITQTRKEWLSDLPDIFYRLHGPFVWLTMVFAALGFLVFSSWRARLFTLGTAGFFLLAITTKKIPAFGRYYAPIWPGLVILAAVFVAALWRRRESPQLTLALRAVGFVCLLALGAQALRGFELSMAQANGVLTATDRLPARALHAAMADDDRGVIGARAHNILLPFEAGRLTWGDQFLTEQEYVTYLTWPSDREVIDMMERHDIGWVLIHPHRQLELQYNNTWLEPTYGVTARHPSAVAASPEFCLQYFSGGWELYKLGTCSPAPG